MPHTRSASKSLRKNEKRRTINRTTKASIKTLVKRFETTLEKGALDQARKEFVIAVKKLDKAAAQRIVHPNMAARKKSQLARMLHVKTTAKPSAKPAGKPEK